MRRPGHRHFRTGLLLQFEKAGRQDVQLLAELVDGLPLPGDLGKPILNAGAAPNTVAPATTPDPEAQRRAQEIEAARLSRLFAQTNQQPQPVGLAAPAGIGTTTGPTPAPPVDAGAAQISAAGLPDLIRG